MTDYPVRERILQQLVKNVQAMTADENNGVAFSHVKREELDHTKKFQGSSVSILDLNEFYTYQTAYLLCTLRVGLEFWYQLKAGEAASTQLGIVAAEIKKLLLSDIHVMEDDTDLQLAENVRIVEDSYDIEGPHEKTVSGFLQFDVIYRVSKTDPYQLM